MRTITGDTHESGNKCTCGFQPDIQKFLVAFRNENLFVNGAAKGHFSGYVSLSKNFGASPAAIFADAHRYRKLIKAEGLFLVKLTRISIQDSKGCCAFQMSLVYNRVC
jgi:hypothetical protein